MDNFFVWLLVDCCWLLVIGYLLFVLKIQSQTANNNQQPTNNDNRDRGQQPTVKIPDLSGKGITTATSLGGVGIGKLETTANHGIFIIQDKTIEIK